MEKKTQKLPYSAFFLLVFAFLFLWFTRIHPLIPFDGDDWTYLSYARLASENADTRRLKTILQYVTTHYAETLSVAEAAGVCQCSPSHFMRWFRQMTGQSFTEYLNACRLNAAAEALRSTDDTVLAVAERTGFKNLSYFNRAFKARFGLTPREYRKR